MTGRVQAVERSINILMALSNGSRTLTEVARATNLSKGTAFRLLVSLNHAQLVVKDPATNIYLLGPGMLRMFQRVMADLGSIGTLAHPMLQELQTISGETVTVHVAIGAERICVAELPSLHPIRYISNVGATAPVYTGSAGRVLLAFLADDERERTLAGLVLHPLTEKTITDMAVLRKEIATVAGQGWAMSFGERISGAAAISVPIQGGGVLASLSVLGPADRMPQERLLELLPAAKRAAEQIQSRLTSPDLMIGTTDAAAG